MIPFYKMHANGNDFIIIDNLNDNITLPPTTILHRWADRQMGVGFDQLLYLSQVKKGIKADVHCRIFNASGKEAEQCGHGIACLANWLYNQGGLPSNQYRISVPAGIYTVYYTSTENVSVYLKGVMFEPSHIPFHTDTSQLLYALPLKEMVSKTTSTPISNLMSSQQKILKHQKVVSADTLSTSFDTPTVWVSVLSLGNPHCIVPVSDIETVSVEVAQQISEHARFPKGVNVEFMQIIERDWIKLKVYERGVGMNRACGTGACAAVIAGSRLGYLEASAQVEFSGNSKVTVQWDKSQNEVVLNTSTHFVFQGDLPDYK